jgi:beta-glucosidase
MLKSVSFISSHLFCIILGGFLLLNTSCRKTEPYKNPDLPIEDRVNDLISRMTLEEKISQMMDIADSIPRLDIPMYNWWNEGLHGVARAGVATVFPQAIGLAASFNDSLIYDVATVISDEFRAKYNDFISKGERDRYKGLTVWSPNINIFRDPRWGRGQETYGEDPYLTSRMGVMFVKGLQGDDAKYLKTIATPKHYVVHSGPEQLRHIFNVDVSQRDFMDTYLPAFEACIKEGGAKSIMGAYNRFRGESCCGSPYLLTRIIRQEWGFNGYVVSDCGAIYDIFGGHKIASSEAEAAAIGVISGCDLNCGNTYESLKEAVERGLITEAQIDVSVKRLMEARIRLGMFDPPGSVAYDTLPLSLNDCQAHRDLSIEAARQSMVLLKNEGDLLPLPKEIRTIAVIGPNADDAEVMYGNYNGTPSKYVTPLEGIRRKVSPDCKVLYSRGCNIHKDMPNRALINGEYIQNNGNQGLKGEFFSNKELSGDPVAVRTDKTIDFFWFDESPTPELSRENFSIRWTGEIVAPREGKYELRVTGDDGYRLYVDNQLVLNKWEKQDMAGSSVYLNFDSGSRHAIKLEYFQELGFAAIKLEWVLPEADIEKEALAAARESDFVIFVGGLSPRLEGEEMRVDLSGFSGGDRTTLDLPASQESLLKKLKSTGKPIVLVLMSGSALAVNWADGNIPAIIQAWYPGQEGGTAIADVLFGDYNPAGRLPVTFYKSVDQLPAFEVYQMKGHTYRYFEGEPLYPFGYGLSYTFFSYSGFMAPETIVSTDSLKIQVDVANTGHVAGDEVVQLYIKHLDSPVPVPLLALNKFKRIHLNPGEKKTLTFTLSPLQLAVIDEQDQRIVLPGKVEVFIGGQQPDQKNVIQGKVLRKEITISGRVNVIDKLNK